MSQASDVTNAVLSVPELDVLVIGAGQAGLATGYHMGLAGLRYQLLDSNSRVGDSWRQRFDSLMLFTPRSYSALPGLAVLGDPNGFPSKDEIADYLEAYGAHFAIPVRVGAAARSLESSGASFRVTTSEGVAIESRAVVIAPGAFQTPNIPAISTAFSGDVHQLAAKDYHRPSSVPAGTVLVVGDGATGREIALELAATHRVLLSTGRARRVTPDRVLGRSIFWWRDHLGVLRASRESLIGRRMKSADPFPGRQLELAHLREAGVTVVTRLDAAQGVIARFADGVVADSAVVWATGYRAETDWVAIPTAKDTRGAFVHTRGISPVDGVYFVGQSLAMDSWFSTDYWGRCRRSLRRCGNCPPPRVVGCRRGPAAGQGIASVHTGGRNARIAMPPSATAIYYQTMGRPRKTSSTTASCATAPGCV